MITVDEALQHVLSHSHGRTKIRAPVQDAMGAVLAEEVFSDIDSPPHDKAMMDGYAISAEELALPTDGFNAAFDLEVIEEVTAGDVPTKSLSRGQATRIMTGAPVPEGVGAVVMIEQTELLNDGSGGQPARVRIRNTALTQGTNILPRATSLAVGQSVLRPGTLIRPIEVGVLSEIGQTEVDIFSPPKVAVMTSGNELVPRHRRL